MRRRWWLAGLLALVGLPLAHAATLVTGAGAPFAYPLCSKWFDEFHKRNPDLQINYPSIGSGGGIRQVLEGTVDFGATDGPMTDEQLKSAPVPILHLPTALGAVVPTFNLPGVERIRFTPEALAGIFLGKVTHWNDPALTKENPGDARERHRRRRGRRREDAGGLPGLDHRPGGRGCLSHRELHLAARPRPHQGRGEGRGDQEVPRLDAGRRAAARRPAQLRAAAGVRGRARAEGAHDDPGRRVLATGRAALLSSPAVRVAPARARRPRRLGDPAFRALSLAFALSVIAIAGTIAVVLLRRSALARAAFGWSFLWTSTWDPVALRFGALPFIYGTLATTAIAIAIALPLGLGAAVCLAELMPRRLADPLTFLIELLVAVPSVIYG